MASSSGGGKGLLLFITLGLIVVFLAIRVIYPGHNKDNQARDSASSANPERVQVEAAVTPPVEQATPAVDTRMLDLNRDGTINEVDFRLFVEQTKNKEMAGMTSPATGAAVPVESATE